MHTSTLETVQEQIDVENNRFFEHFKIEAIISLKCLAASWNRHGEKQFLLKSIPESAVATMKELTGRERTTQMLNDDDYNVNEMLLHDWVNLKVPHDGLVQCYGQL